jgi:flagellar biosynthetic protein FliR
MTGIQQFWELIVNNYIGFLLVLARTTGIFSFNPVFGRTVLPARARVAISLVLAMCTFAVMGGTLNYTPASMPGFILAIVKEGLIGIVLGIIMYLFITAFIYAGEMIDNQAGFAMARTMDPTSGVSMPIIGNLFTYMFMMYFFLTGGHLIYIRLFALSYTEIPVDYPITLSFVSLMRVIVFLFGSCIELGIKMSMPVIVTSLVVEFVMGMIMRTVPSIQVFVINIQVKIAVALIILLITAKPITDSLQGVMDIMWANIYSASSQFV